MSVIVFILLYIYLIQWQSFVALFDKLRHPRQQLTLYHKPSLQKRLRKVTARDFQIYRLEQDKFAGFMLLVPEDTMILTSKVLDELPEEAIEWIVLHEAGHRLMHHNFKALLLGIAVVGGGAISISLLHLNTAVAALLAVFCAIVSQQFGRISEYEADHYAVTHMSNPQGMIEGNLAFIAASKSFIYKHNLLRVLFTPHPSYQQRIAMAEAELARRG